ncbi:MerR family transcriptional regulator [Demequina muriae]|uniref:MerR family DNA-binding transcriptional regulator n=1 Tax=Demequina muriae TaxID=3051664 RepID=A0ABT8GL26_9MICO|nr:MerR family transcriptional regulator [Demequina sp. EGI L300058]MDN4481636.1 MerR family DNA-binding transcriptional regulator [Demequina sp. EGI L300058]
MTWSTRELAEMAGTTVNTVRHYHALGLLEPPSRTCNGYKQYEVRHLVTLTRVRRLAELGVPLAQVGAIALRAGAAPSALLRLDAELRSHIRTLRRARKDIAAIVRDHAPADSPRGFERVASQLSEADLSYLHILTRLHDGHESLSVLRDMIDTESQEVRDQLGGLRLDASAASRQRLAERMTADGAQWRSPTRPWLGSRTETQRERDVPMDRILDEALTELYTPAQRDVLMRADAVCTRLPARASRLPSRIEDTDSQQSSRSAEQWLAPAGGA